MNKILRTCRTNVFPVLKSPNISTLIRAKEGQTTMLKKMILAKKILEQSIVSSLMKNPTEYIIPSRLLMPPTFSPDRSVKN